MPPLVHARAKGASKTLVLWCDRKEVQENIQVEKLLIQDGFRSVIACCDGSGGIKFPENAGNYHGA